MPTTKQKRLRAERETAKRRRLHGRSAQVQRVPATIDRLEPIAMALPDGRYIPANSPSMQNLVADVAPSRAKCPACGFSQKVRKDGTIGSHGATPGSSLQCEGTGQPWTTASPA